MLAVVTITQWDIENAVGGLVSDWKQKEKLISIYMSFVI